ncbi:hypothetical protein B0H11DRAFT_2353638 [Mycena galericulata]|nr:hypothetical protein B0H11DRAFT_2353638 [Mycena galericulata]
MCNLQRLTTLLVVLTSLSAVHARFYTAPFRRQDPTETVTFDITPFPTHFTDASVASAYSVYSALCGSSLDAAAYSLLPGYIAEGGASDAQITGTAFYQWFEEEDQNDVINCQQANNHLDAAEFNAPDSTTNPLEIPPSTTMAAPPGTTETSPDVPSGTFSGSIPPCFGIAGLVQVGDCQSSTPTATQQTGEPEQPGGGSVTETSAPSSPSNGSASPADRRASFFVLVAAVGISLWN